MPDASKQTKTLQLQLAITSADLADAIDNALAEQANVPVHVLKTRGTYHDQLCQLITAALASHLSVGA